jgi:hypothetical protein
MPFSNSTLFGTELKNLDEKMLLSIQDMWLVDQTI